MPDPSYLETSETATSHATLKRNLGTLRSSDLMSRREFSCLTEQMERHCLTLQNNKLMGMASDTAAKTAQDTMFFSLLSNMLVEVLKHSDPSTQSENLEKVSKWFEENNFALTVKPRFGQSRQGSARAQANSKTALSSSPQPAVILDLDMMPRDVGEMLEAEEIIKDIVAAAAVDPSEAEIPAPAPTLDEEFDTLSDINTDSLLYASPPPHSSRHGSGRHTDLGSTRSGTVVTPSPLEKFESFQREVFRDQELYGRYEFVNRSGIAGAHRYAAHEGGERPESEPWGRSDSSQNDLLSVVSHVSNSMVARREKFAPPPRAGFRLPSVEMESLTDCSETPTTMMAVPVSTPETSAPDAVVQEPEVTVTSLLASHTHTVVPPLYSAYGVHFPSALKDSQTLPLQQNQGKLKNSNFGKGYGAKQPPGSSTNRAAAVRPKSSKKGASEKWQTKPVEPLNDEDLDDYMKVENLIRSKSKRRERINWREFNKMMRAQERSEVRPKSAPQYFSIAKPVTAGDGQHGPPPNTADEYDDGLARGMTIKIHLPPGLSAVGEELDSIERLNEQLRHELGRSFPPSEADPATTEVFEEEVEGDLVVQTEQQEFVEEGTTCETPEKTSPRDELDQELREVMETAEFDDGPQPHPDSVDFDRHTADASCDPLDEGDFEAEHEQAPSTPKPYVIDIVLNTAESPRAEYAPATPRSEDRLHCSIEYHKGEDTDAGSIISRASSADTAARLKSALNVQRIQSSPLPRQGSATTRNKILPAPTTPVANFMPSYVRERVTQRQPVVGSVVKNRSLPHDRFKQVSAKGELQWKNDKQAQHEKNKSESYKFDQWQRNYLDVLNIKDKERRHKLSSVLAKQQDDTLWLKNRLKTVGPHVDFYLATKVTTDAEIHRKRSKAAVIVQRFTRGLLVRQWLSRLNRASGGGSFVKDAFAYKELLLRIQKRNDVLRPQAVINFVNLEDYFKKREVYTTIFKQRAMGGTLPQDEIMPFLNCCDLYPGVQEVKDMLRLLFQAVWQYKSLCLVDGDGGTSSYHYLPTELNLQ